MLECAVCRRDGRLVIRRSCSYSLYLSCESGPRLGLSLEYETGGERHSTRECPLRHSPQGISDLFGCGFQDASHLHTIEVANSTASLCSHFENDICYP